MLLFFLLFRRSLVRIIGQGSCYDAYSTEGTYLIGGENIWIYSILTGMFRDRFDKNMKNGTRGCLCLLRNCRVRKTR